MKCEKHRDSEAIGFCSNCGRGVCEDCKVELDDNIYCNDCIDYNENDIECPNCGKEVPEGGEFCPECGSAISTYAKPLKPPSTGILILGYALAILGLFTFGLCSLGGMVVGYVIYKEYSTPNTHISILFVLSALTLIMGIIIGIFAIDTYLFIDAITQNHTASNPDTETFMGPLIIGWL